MAIPVTCPHCHETFRIKEKYSGRQGACPACHRSLQVPALSEMPVAAPDGDGNQPPSSAPTEDRSLSIISAAPAPAPPATLDRYRWFCETRCADPRITAQEFTAALAGQSFRPHVPVRYRLYSGLLTAWVIAMPILYVALVVGVAALTLLLAHLLLHLDPQEMKRSSGKGVLGMILVVFGGLFACFLMIRPLFVRAQRGEQPPGLDRQEAPLLFLLIERICAALGAV